MNKNETSQICRVLNDAGCQEVFVLAAEGQSACEPLEVFGVDCSAFLRHMKVFREGELFNTRKVERMNMLFFDF